MPTLLTVRQAAELLQVHPQTIYTWIRTGRIPCVRHGGTVRLRREDVVPVPMGEAREEARCRAR